MSRIYFCVFCPQKYIEKSDENIRKHLKNRHLITDNECEESVDKWIDSLVNYETDLNRCLDLTPKQLPQNNVKNLMIGCKLCDRIIESFKLKIETKSKNVCVCGKGSEEPLAIVTCKKCKHRYHYDCVESIPYSGQEFSFYKCVNCKEKKYEISELCSERITAQRVHCHRHLLYEPFICKLPDMSTENGSVCNQRFYWSNFIEAHLKSEHNVVENVAIDALKKNYRYERIFKIQQLIDSSVRLPNISPRGSLQTKPSVKSIATNSKTIQSSSTIANKSQTIPNTRDLNTTVHYSQQINKNFQTHSNRDITQMVQKRVVINGSSHTISTTRNRDITTAIQKTPQINSNFRNTPNRNVTKTMQNSTPINSNKRQIKVYDNYYAKKQLKTTRDAVSPTSGQKSGQKRGRGRPRKTTKITPVCDQNQTNVSHNGGQNLLRNSSLKVVRLSKSTSNGRSPEPKRRNEEKPVGNDSDSDWDSDIDQFELGLSSNNKNSDKVKPIQTRVMNSQNKSPINAKQPITEVNRSQSSQTAVQVNRSQLSGILAESNRSEFNPNESLDSFTVEVPQIPIEYDLESEKRVEASDSSTVESLSAIERPQQSIGMNTTSNQSISSPDSSQQITASLKSTPISTTITRVIDQNVGYSQINSNYSEWLTHTIPKKNPYFPQIGDEVVYIPYGHSLYIKRVKDEALYNHRNNKIMKTHLNDKVIARVVKIEYNNESNIRLVKLTLKTDDQNNSEFKVRYHDIDNVIDFIVLKQTYNKSLQNNWKPGQDFRAIVDDKWWFGIIAALNCNEMCLKTLFQSHWVLWGNNTRELLCYWDLNPVEGPVPQNKCESFEVNAEDRNKFYTPEGDEWPNCGKDEECKRLAEGLAKIIEYKESQKFILSVDVTQHPIYGLKIAYPLNLNIVKERLENGFYRRLDAIRYDVKFIESNAELLYGSNSDITRNAKIITSVIQKFIDNQRCRDPTPIYHYFVNQRTSKLKYYSPPITSNIRRKHLPSNNTTNEDLEAIINSITSRPSTSGFRRTNTQPNERTIDPQIITLSDDSEDEEVFDDSNDEEIEANNANHVMQDSPQNTIDDQSEDATEEPLLESIHYFCIFCNQKFVDKSEANHHFSHHLNADLKCILCPKSKSFKSLVDFQNHDKTHVEFINREKKLNYVEISASISWIDSFLTYIETLNTETLLINNISTHFANFCPICNQLRSLTQKTKQLFDDNILKRNCETIPFKQLESSFSAHLNLHLRYNPKYECTLCRVHKLEPIYSCKQIDLNSKSHLNLTHVHHLEGIESFNDIDFLFDNSLTYVPKLDQFIKDLVNQFVIFSYH